MASKRSNGRNHLLLQQCPQKIYKPRSTSPADHQKLKNFELAKRPTLAHISSLTVTGAYAWTCWLRSMDAIGQKVEENEPQHMSCPADFRARLDPPLPRAYFGNCLMPCIATCTYAEVVGEEGVLNAAVRLGEAIHKTLNNKDGVAKGAWLSEIRKIAWQKSFGVVGSPKYDAYDVDFGWGMPKKYESITLDETRTLNKSRKYGGGLEFGLSLSKKRMDAFETIFTDGLKIP